MNRFLVSPFSDLGVSPFVNASCGILGVELYWIKSRRACCSLKSKGSKVWCLYLFHPVVFPISTKQGYLASIFPTVCEKPGRRCLNKYFWTSQEIWCSYFSAFDAIQLEETGNTQQYKVWINSVVDNFESK